MDAVDFLAHWVDRATIAWPADLAPDPTAVTWELWAAPAGGLSVVDGVVAARRAPAVRIAGLALDPSGLTVRQLEVRGHLAGYLALRVAADRADIERALLGQVAVLQRGPGGEPRLLTGVQLPGVLDDLYADAARASTLGPSFGRDGVPTVRLWAPTATGVRLLLEQTSAAAPGRRWHAPVSLPMARGLDGVWSVTGEPGWRDARYRFAVTVYAPSVGAVVTSKVTDPYSVGLTVNSTRSVLVDLADPALAPAGWTDTRAPRVERRVDRAIYELHIRDFSAHDETVPEELRGTYSAFTVPDSDGMTRLAELAAAGMNTVHLLPCFDIATIEEDRARQRVAVVPEAGPADEAQQAAVVAVADHDAYNWGYDPFHYSTPEGSYAPADRQEGGARTVAFREMVGALHRAGYQVVLDQVFNHTADSGQGRVSVLDRIVPGYYHRLDARGAVENSTCCHNTATEHAMMERLMVDSVVTWATAYRVDGFRFDLMGHHSGANLLAVRNALDALTLEADGVDGRAVLLYGEGWDFGEVAGNARFRQATQGQLAGTHIATFNDRLRDAVLGGSPFDSDKVAGQGFGTGLFSDPNGASTATPEQQRADLLHRQDLIRLSLAGNLRDYAFETRDGRVQSGAELGYNGLPAGYAEEPDEALAYVDAHDNETLFDIGIWKLPVGTPMAARIRMNTLALATVALGQSPLFWHAGTDLLRSKSLDRDSFNSGDHFNRLDWAMRRNNFGVGLPPASHNAAQWAAMRPLLADPALTPSPADIAEAHARALDLLRLRRAYPLLRLGSARRIRAKVSFPNAGPGQSAGLILLRIDDTRGRDVDPDLDGLLVAFNASPETIVEEVDGMAGLRLSLAPLLLAGGDPVLTRTTWDAPSGTLSIPGRSVAVLVQPSAPA
ncbi:pullulanase-type alpha-1,6-glucosidase [Tessaracoccus defluvii]|uniref:pullulanase-type alpha-1,6-glucosidase n=2 Tax=Tessaracoccus defluvii TaxID=1285901 RepID=UPI0031DA95C5